MGHPVLAVGLAGFWLLLSGHYSPLLLGLGAVSVALVIWLVGRLDAADETNLRLRFSPGLLRYLGWLFGQIIQANVDVGKRILDPKLPIKPVWKPLAVDLDSDMQKTLYASSITITPDTFTTHIEEDGRLMVHALWPESIDNLREGDMQRRVKETGI